jgi:hypothetical protein
MNVRAEDVVEKEKSVAKSQETIPEGLKPALILWHLRHD